MESVLYKDDDYTIDDLDNLADGQRAELIDGEIFLMASPTPEHQELVVALLSYIHNYLNGKHGPCKAYTAPLDVYLDAKKTRKHVVQPDIFVLCDPDKKQDKCILGAPDWVIEVASPSTASKDRLLKAYWYEMFGVKEYWVVNRTTEEVLIYVYGDHPSSNTYTIDDEIAPTIYPDLKIRIRELI